MTGNDLAAAAQSLVGTPFRLHGRDPQSGLDCIGLFGAAMACAGFPVTLPNGYPLRTLAPEAWLPAPESCGFATAEGVTKPGDVLLMRLGAAQVHLAIVAAQGWVHAHAGLRRVVCGPPLAEARITHRWRLAPHN